MESPKVLKKMRLFGALTPAELLKVAEVVKSRKCKQGRTIIHERKQGASIYVVKKGELKVTHLVRGKRRELGTVCAGQHFGELSFIDKKPRSASVYAAEDSELLVITRKTFDKLLESTPQLQAKLLQALLEDVCQKLRERVSSLDFELSDLLPISVFEMDRLRNITFANRTGLDFFGYSQKDFEKGLKALGIFAPEHRERARRSIRKILSGEDPGVEEYSAIRKDGSSFTVIVHWDAIATEGKTAGFRLTLVDITERKRSEESLLRLQKAVETMNIGVCITDTEGKILYANPAEAEMHGYGPRELIGQSARTFAPLAIWNSANLHRIKEMKSWRREGINIRKDGSIFPVQLISEAVSSIDGQLIGLVTTCEDISERKLIEQMKNDLIALVSHELKTPLASIISSLTLIEDTQEPEISEHSRNLIEIALRNSKQMARLVNDLLDLEKIKSGKMNVRMEPLELTSFVEKALETNGPYARQFRVKVVLNGRLPGLLVKADSDRLMQVMTNLLSNAVKFSPPNDCVSVALSSYDKSLRVAVTDHGPGIPEEMRSRIFERFAPIRVLEERQRKGTGLGLSISKALIGMMGGTIGFETKGNEGTTFYFDLPKYPSE